MSDDPAVIHTWRKIQDQKGFLDPESLRAEVELRLGPEAAQRTYEKTLRILKFVEGMHDKIPTPKI